MGSHLFCVEAETFGTIVSFYPTQRATASFYARKFVVALDHFGQIFTDVIDYTELFEDDLDTLLLTREADTEATTKAGRSSTHSIFSSDTPITPLQRTRTKRLP